MCKCCVSVEFVRYICIFCFSRSVLQCWCSSYSYVTLVALRNRDAHELDSSSRSERDRSIIYPSVIISSLCCVTRTRMAFFLLQRKIFDQMSLCQYKHTEQPQTFTSPSPNWLRDLFYYFIFLFIILFIYIFYYLFLLIYFELFS